MQWYEQAGQKCVIFLSSEWKSVVWGAEVDKVIGGFLWPQMIMQRTSGFKWLTETLGHN